MEYSNHFLIDKYDKVVPPSPTWQNRICVSAFLRETGYNSPENANKQVGGNANERTNTDRKLYQRIS